MKKSQWPQAPMAITLAGPGRTGRPPLGAHSNASATSVYSDYVDSRSPSPLSSHRALYLDNDESDMDTDLTSNNSRAPSIFSYDSSRDAVEMLKVENGRTFNNQSDTYYLPAGQTYASIYPLIVGDTDMGWKL